jgi:cell filamentation protein
VILDNKLGITDQIELAKCEEKISKQKANVHFDIFFNDFIKVTLWQGVDMCE